ncbi:MAG: hypothetical protein ACMUIA_04230 [bacterium]
MNRWSQGKYFLLVIFLIVFVMTLSPAGAQEGDDNEAYTQDQVLAVIEEAQSDFSLKCSGQEWLAPAQEEGEDDLCAEVQHDLQRAQELSDYGKYDEAMGRARRCLRRLEKVILKPPAQQ